jgi:hypothetical protein
MRACYVAGESGIAIFALVAEKSRVRNSLRRHRRRISSRSSTWRLDPSARQRGYTHIVRSLTRAHIVIVGNKPRRSAKSSEKAREGRGRVRARRARRCA